jgi:hypothetical protein
MDCRRRPIVCAGRTDSLEPVTPVMKEAAAKFRGGFFTHCHLPFLFDY